MSRMLRKLLPLIVFCATMAFALDERMSMKTPPIAQGRKPALDSQQLEKEIQALNWNQFRSVVESIPQLKAEIEKYGPAGWQYVKARYKTHAWRRSVERLKDADRQQLAKLLQAARKAR